MSWWLARATWCPGCASAVDASTTRRRPPRRSQRSRPSPRRRRRTRSSSPPSGEARGHDALFRLVSNEREAVAAWPPTRCACADNVPPGARSRIAAASAPGRRTSPPSRSGASRARCGSACGTRARTEPGRREEVHPEHRVAQRRRARAMARGVRGAASERPGSIETRRRETRLRPKTTTTTTRSTRARSAPSARRASTPRGALASRVAVTDVDPAAVRNAAYNAARGARCSDGARASKATDASRTPPGRRRVFRRVRSRGSIARAARCVATTLDWNDPEPILAGVRRAPRGTTSSRSGAARRRGRRRRTSTSRDGDFAASRDDVVSDDDFRLRLRLRVVVASAPLPPRVGRGRRARGRHGSGVARAVGELIGPRARRRADMQPRARAQGGRGRAPGRAGGERRSSFAAARRERASRVGMEEETEDVALDDLRDPKRGGGGGAAGRGGRRRGVGPVRRVKQARGFAIITSRCVR